MPKAEILAPAGDFDCLKAAVGAGADAVYFGLANGFNARAKAQNVTLEDLPRVFDYLHARNVKGYVTFNTVVYDSELDDALACLTAIARAGADAVIVQDLGIAKLCHQLAPSLHLHASTQMTVSSPEAAVIAQELGVKRIVVPRELSIDEIKRFAANTPLELECFVHGALCVSYSGQCLTSEAWGQRSANRGQCAQSCRLPYDLVVDGRHTDKGVEQYLLSPKDLAAYNLLPALLDAGVVSFKIEGRYKGPDYVAGAVEKYRRVLDAAHAAPLTGKPPQLLSRADEEELALTYSRGISPGWLLGDDHQELSHGVHPGHRGLFVGTVVSTQGFLVRVKLAEQAPALKPGDWMVFEQGRPEDDEPKGGIFTVGKLQGHVQELFFGVPGPDLSRVRPGDALWKSHDSAVKKRLLRYVDTERKLPVDVRVSGKAGEVLTITATDVLGRSATATSGLPLTVADSSPLNESLMREKLASFGDSGFVLRHLDNGLEGSLMLPPSELKRTRRALVAALCAIPLPSSAHAVTPIVYAPATAVTERSAAKLVVLCRTAEQVEACLALGCDEVILDFMELVGLKKALERCRTAGVRVVVATMRIQKPGEEPIDKRFGQLKPDGVLARHLGALHYFRERQSDTLSLHGDFSLNAANAVTARLLLDMGLATLTPSYDLNIEQLLELAHGVPAHQLEVTVHQHLPLYHTEYCVYAHNMSQGKDYKTCGRPCESHRASLRDAKGHAHPVLVDVGCRNTVFNAQAQSAAAHMKKLQDAGVSRFRVELVWENAEETTAVVKAYRELINGTINPVQVLKRLGALERYGVTSGTLATQKRATLPVVS